jgi:hypothetical protein
MAVGTIGVKPGNIIVPVTNLTKRTKQLVITTYVTSSGWTCRRGVAIFTADSAGAWRMQFNFRAFKDSGTATSTTFDIAGVVFKNIASYSNYQAVTVMGNVSLSALNGYAESNTDNIVISSDEAYDSIEVSGDVELDAEPTWASLGTTWATAAENLAGVDVYIPFGQTGSPGEVLTTGATAFGNCGSSSAYANIVSLALTPGKWLMNYLVSVSRNSATLSGPWLYGVSTNSASTTGTTFGYDRFGGNLAGIGVSDYSTVSGVLILTPTISTTYYLINRVDYSGGNPQHTGYLTAVRLAGA